jgi:hypothetical protein
MIARDTLIGWRCNCPNDGSCDWLSQPNQGRDIINHALHHLARSGSSSSRGKNCQSHPRPSARSQQIRKPPYIRYAEVPRPLTARPQLHLPAPWKLTRGSKRARVRDRDVSLCAPRVRVRQKPRVVQRTRRQAHPVTGSDAGSPRTG